jgi:Zn-dependent protease
MSTLDAVDRLLDPQDPADVETVRSALAAKRKVAKKKGLGHTLGILGISIAAFGLYQQKVVGDTIVDIAALVVVLLVHEGGHLLAMRVFGYENLDVLFIPGLGAAARGRKLHTTATERAMVSLMGPLPGLLFAFGATFFMPLEGELMSKLLLFALLINGFNLLPMMPLDGGRYFDEFLFARWPLLRQIVGHLSGLALALIGWQLEAWILLAVGVLVFMTAAGARIAAAGAADLSAAIAARERTLEPLPEQIPDALIPDAMRSANGRVFSRSSAKPKPDGYASIIALMWSRVGKVPPPSGATVAWLLIAYFASVGLVVATSVRLGVI